MDGNRKRRRTSGDGSSSSGVDELERRRKVARRSHDADAVDVAAATAAAAAAVDVAAAAGAADLIAAMHTVDAAEGVDEAADVEDGVFDEDVSAAEEDDDMYDADKEYEESVLPCSQNVTYLGTGEADEEDGEYVEYLHGDDELFAELKTAMTFAAAEAAEGVDEAAEGVDEAVEGIDEAAEGVDEARCERCHMEDEALLKVEGETGDVEAAVLDTTFTAEEADGLPPRRVVPLHESYEYAPELLGKGGYGEVKKGKYKDEDKWTMAVKIMLDTTTNRDLTLIKRELAILSHLDHQNVCKLLDSYRWEKRQVFFNLELCRINLEDFHCRTINSLRSESFKHNIIKFILQEILTGTAYMHYKNVVHRDLKEDNILLTVEGGVKIADFGLSRVMEVATEGRRRHHSRGIGTNWYMAPEIIMSKCDYGGEVDVWSIGIIANVLYTNTHIHDIFDTFDIQLLQKIERYIGHIPDIPDRLAHYRPHLNTTEEHAFSPLYMKIYHMRDHEMDGENDTEANFIKRLLTLNQSARPTAEDMKNDVYFTTDPLPATTTDLKDLIHEILVEYKAGESPTLSSASGSYDSTSH